MTFQSPWAADIMMTRSLILVLPAAAAVALLPGAANHAPLLARPLPPSPLRVPRSPQMLPRKKKVVIEEEEDEEGWEDKPGRQEAYLSQQQQTVDGMVTSLGKESELEPFPGPPVYDEERVMLDSRAVFCRFATYPAGSMPGESLQEAHLAWLQQESFPGNVSLCLPHYMLAAESFENFFEFGDVLSDDDITRLDAIDEQARAAAAAAAEAAAPADGGEEAAAEAAAAVAVASPPAPLEMEQVQLQFTLGQLTVARSPTWEAARAWARTDPISQVGGHGPEGGVLHQWLVSTDEALSVRPTGDQIQTYVVHCVDKPGATDLRAATREKHLAWLAESGRVYMGGPLLALDDAAGAESKEGEGVVGVGPRVGTLLVVGGDELEEVRGWATSDPYNGAGLFESVTVAPLMTYDVESSQLASVK